MKEEIKDAIERYQCPGCITGSDISCFEKSDYGDGCGKHRSGTMIGGAGKIFLGMPKGFNRLGVGLGGEENMKLRVFSRYEERLFDQWNVPTWKHLNEHGHTLVRGLMPRRNEPFLFVILENCIDKINCLEITDTDIQGMD